MAPPQLVSLQDYSDVAFRDVVHRRSMLVASNTGGNVAQQLFHHFDGTAAKLSAAGLATTDEGGNAQYSLVLSSSARSLDANTFTSANLEGWTANSVFSANATHFSVRAPTLTANAISCSTLSLGNDVSFANVSASRLTVTGNIQIDTNTLTVDAQNNRVGIGTTTPQYPLDVVGDAYIRDNIYIGSGASDAQARLVALATNHTIDNKAMITVKRVITGSTVGSGVSIGRIGKPNTLAGTAIIDLQITSIEPKNLITKSYRIPYNSGIALIGMRRAIPVTSFPYNDPDNDVGIDLEALSDSTLDLKLVRTSANVSTINTSTVYQISITINFHKDALFTVDDGWAPSTAAYTSPLPTNRLDLPRANIYQGTQITSTGLGVGINTEVPRFELDVYGNAVFNDNTFIGTNVTDSARFFASGTNHIIDCDRYYSANVSLPNATVLSGAYVCNVTATNSCTLDVTINQFENTSNHAFSKSYVIPLVLGRTLNDGNWCRCLPAYHGALQGNDVDLDVKYSSTNTLEIALVRSNVLPGIITTRPFSFSMKVRMDKFKAPPTIAPRSGSYTGFNVTTVGQYWTFQPLTVGADGVGILTDMSKSKYFFDVGGQSQIRGGLNLNGFASNKSFLSFENKWRIYYNSVTENLEIQKNNDPNDHTWSGNTVTAILAAM